MKILYLIPSLENSGGMERVLTQKINYLVNNTNFEILVLTTDMADNSTPYFQLSPKVKTVNLKIYFNDLFKLPLLKKMISMRKLLIQYKQQLRYFIIDNNVDICISMGGKELEFLYDLDVPCKKIFESHFSKGIRTRTLLATKGESLFWRSIAYIREWQNIKQTKFLNKVVVLTKRSEQDWALTNSNVITIPNPTSFNVVETPPKLVEKKVIAVGRLEFEKGFDLLLKAWAQVKITNPDWKLHIFGEGTEKSNLQKLILDLGLHNQVFLKSQTKQVATEIYNSSLLVLSSRYEGMPMVMLESLACGVPMVAFDCETGPSELIENSDCGLLAKVGNIEDLSSKIKELINDRALRVEMSKVAILKAEKYQIDTIMESWINLFNDILKRQSSDLK